MSQAHLSPVTAMAFARPRRLGVALIMVLLVLSTLAVVGVPFVLSMVLQDREAHYFADRIKARFAAEAARNHAIARLQDTAYSSEWEREAEQVDAGRSRVRLEAAPASARRGTPKKKRRNTLESRRSRVVRKDFGEKSRRSSGKRSIERSEKKSGKNSTRRTGSKLSHLHI